MRRARSTLIEPGPQPMSRMVMLGLMCGRRCGAELVAVRLLWVPRTEGEWSVVWADILVRFELIVSFVN